MRRSAESFSWYTLSSSLALSDDTPGKALAQRIVSGTLERLPKIGADGLAHELAAPADDHERGMLAYNRGDVVGAMSALRAPAKAGYAPSQVMLAFILDRADFVDEAAKLYAEAAAQNAIETRARAVAEERASRVPALEEQLQTRNRGNAPSLVITACSLDEFQHSDG